MVPMAPYESSENCDYCHEDPCICVEGGTTEVIKVKYLEDSVFISVYLRDRAYGGPEEGGWWYETGELIRSTQVLSSDEAICLQELEQAWCDENNKGRYPVSSVLSTGRYCVYVEDEPGAHYPLETPRYE